MPWKPNFRISEIALAARPKSVVYVSPSRSSRGALAIVTNVGRDAMDAEVPLTSGAEADGEIVWSWRRDAGVKSAEVIPPATVAKEPFTGEHV